MFRSSSIVFLAFAAAACASDTTAPSSITPTSPDASLFGDFRHDAGGAVFTLSNAAGGNAVLAFARGANGSLSPAGSYPTGGNGTGAGLGSQGAVVLSNSGRWLFAVNAGSNTVTSFAVNGTALTPIATVPSGGTTPISLTTDDHMLYVLNGGGAGNIVGFTISHSGGLTMLPGSARPLSGSGVGPAEVAFDPTGNWLVVTEKMTNKIDTYRVANSGYASGPIVNASSGETPFGFAFSRLGVLLVSEAFGGAPDASALSSYFIQWDGHLRVISSTVPTTETAACWVVVTDNTLFAYTANTGSASVSGYAVLFGKLHLLDRDGRTGEAQAAPADAALSRNSQYLYTLNGGAHTISVFDVRPLGSLGQLAPTSGIPAGASGLAAR